jgi:hypothetical protein
VGPHVLYIQADKNVAISVVECPGYLGQYSLGSPDPALF